MEKRAVVVGGGFAGLTTAYYLSRAGFFVEIHEKSDSWGGLLKTHHTEWGMIETAANGILRTQALVELCQDINVSLITASERSRKKFIYRNSPKRWPLSWMETLTLFPSVISLLINRSHKKPKPGQNLSHWVKHTLNPTALEYLIAPALQGVYASDPEKLSAPLIMNRFFNPRSSREKREKLSTVAPERGMGELVNRLVEWLRVHRVVLHLNSHYTLPERLDCPHVVCTGLGEASQIIKGQAPQLYQKLSEVDRHSLLSTTVFFQRSSEDLEGFGCLFPRSENFFHLGVLYNDCIFKNRSDKYRSETWIGGGALNPRAIGHSDEEILEWILKDRRRIQENSEVQFSQTTRWPEILPNYGLELEKALEKILGREKALERSLKEAHLEGGLKGSLGGDHLEGGLEGSLGGDHLEGGLEGSLGGDHLEGGLEGSLGGDHLEGGLEGSLGGDHLEGGLEGSLGRDHLEGGLEEVWEEITWREDSKKAGEGAEKKTGFFLNIFISMAIIWGDSASVVFWNEPPNFPVK